LAKNLFTSEELLQKNLKQLRQGLGTFYSAIAGAQAGDIAQYVLGVDNQAISIVRDIAGDIAGDIVSAIAGAITVMDMEYELKILKMAKLSSNRADLLSYLNMSNHRKNYTRYMLPMLEKGWLIMTLPDKPTSPKQQYLTTLKERLILEFLKRKTK
jgi:hypothetical protein